MEARRSYHTIDIRQPADLIPSGRGPATPAPQPIRSVPPSPCLVYNAGKMRFAGEAELTAASYGTPDVFGKVRDARFVRNVRFLLAAYYFF